MEQISHALLVASVLLFAAVALSAASARLGVPSLLVFLAVGLVATELPGAPVVDIPVATAALIGNLALAVILLDGGLRTRFGTLRMVAGPALTLATLGVLITASAVGAIAVALLGLDWRYGLLLGAIVGSTDAAAVFALLGGGGLRLNERVEATLEVESGLNDPMAVFLTVAMIELIRVPGSGFATIAPMFAQQLLVGLAVGWALGHLLGRVVARIRLGEGLYVLLIQSGGLAVFAVASVLGGSGFLAIYLAGMIVANQRRHVTVDVLRVSDGFAWLAQATMFLLLGVITDLAELLTVVTGKVLVVVLALMLVARPLAAVICLLPVPLSAQGSRLHRLGRHARRGADRARAVPAARRAAAGLVAVPHRVPDHADVAAAAGKHAGRGGAAGRRAASAGVGRAVERHPRRRRAAARGGAVPRGRGVAGRRWGRWRSSSGPSRSAWSRCAATDRIVAVERLRAGDLVTVVATEAALPELEVLFGPPAPVGELTLDPRRRSATCSSTTARSLPADADPATQAHRVRVAPPAPPRRGGRRARRERPDADGAAGRPRRRAPRRPAAVVGRGADRARRPRRTSTIRA